MITVSLKGIEGLQAAINKKEKALIVGVDSEMAGSIATINAQQKRMAPVDSGLLRSSLNQVKIAPLDYSILSIGPGSSYAPYQEFGTGGLVSIPEGLEEEAAQFKGAGIRKVNMKAQPFFFPPLFMEKPKLIKRILELLKG
jgi:HK97 gp10 family phage protein